MRVGNVRARHRHQIDMALGDRPCRAGDIANRGSVQNRDIDFRLDGAGQIQERRWRERHVRREHRRQMRKRVALTLIDADIVNQPAVGEQGGDAQAVGRLQPALQQLVARHAQADDKAVADTFTDCTEHLQAEAGPVLQTAAVAVRAPVGHRREEAIDQVMGSGDHFNAVKPAALASLGGIGEGRNGTGEIPILHFLRIGTMRLLAGHRRRDQRQPVLAAPVRAPPDMGDLAEDRSAVAMHPLADAVQIRQHAVVAKVHLGKRSGESGATADEPPKIVRPMPPRAFSAW